MKLFTEFLANLNKERAGDTYRPANGTEGDMFFAGECQDCIHQTLTLYTENHMCFTEAKSWRDIDDEQYPIELQYGTDGQPCCRRKMTLPTRSKQDNPFIPFGPE